MSRPEGPQNNSDKQAENKPSGESAQLSPEHQALVDAFAKISATLQLNLRLYEQDLAMYSKALEKAQAEALQIALLLIQTLPENREFSQRWFQPQAGKELDLISQSIETAIYSSVLMGRKENTRIKEAEDVIAMLKDYIERLETLCKRIISTENLADLSALSISTQMEVLTDLDEISYFGVLAHLKALLPKLEDDKRIALGSVWESFLRLQFKNFIGNSGSAAEAASFQREPNFQTLTFAALCKLLTQEGIPLEAQQVRVENSEGEVNSYYKVLIDITEITADTELTKHLHEIIAQPFLSAFLSFDIKKSQNLLKLDMPANVHLQFLVELGIIRVSGVEDAK